MKKNLLYSGVMALVLTSMANFGHLYAQDKKEITKSIIIKNGDTIINGKNLKNVSKAERKNLLQELDGFKELKPGTIFIDADKNEQVVISRKHSGEPEQLIIKQFGDAQKSGNRKTVIARSYTLSGDSLLLNLDGDSIMKNIRIQIDSVGDMKHEFRIMKDDNNEDAFEFRVSPPLPPNGPMAPKMWGQGAPNFRFEREEPKNSQSFSFYQTDKDGISNHLNIRVEEVKPETAQKISGHEKAPVELAVEDLVVFPSFSTGKINVAFNLNNKGLSTVKILNSDLKTVFTDQAASTNYYKSFDLPKNGLYYLAVSQNGGWFIKKIIKE